VVDTPDSGNDDSQAKSDSEQIRTAPETTDSAPSSGKQEEAKHQHRYAQNIAKALKAVGRRIAAVVNWTDHNNGFITALATVAIAVLPSVYVHYSRAQWKVMRDQLPELKAQSKAAQDSAIAAQNAVIQARDQFRQDSRPYVWITNGGIGAPKFVLNKNPETGENLKTGQIIWTYHFTDYGKAPAMICSRTCPTASELTSRFVNPTASPKPNRAKVLQCLQTRTILIPWCLTQESRRRNTIGFWDRRCDTHSLAT
jgi:hypothetical protein